MTQLEFFVPKIRSQRTQVEKPIDHPNIQFDVEEIKQDVLVQPHVKFTMD